MKNLFVGNITFQTTEDDLRSIFEPFGEIARIQVITDRDTGRSRGFGFVEMADAASADQAIEALNGKEVGGRALNVNEARPRPERAGNGYSGRRAVHGAYRSGGGYDGDGRQRREPRS